MRFRWARRSDNFADDAALDAEPAYDAAGRFDTLTYGNNTQVEATYAALSRLAILLTPRPTADTSDAAEEPKTDGNSDEAVEVQL